MATENVATKTKWVSDIHHSEIMFKIRHLMISNVTGYVNDFNASIETSDEFQTGEATFEAAVSSISTKNEQRDGHLQSPDFFDAENHPKMTFKSTEFKDGKLTGDLTIRGTTKEITFDVEFNGIATGLQGEIRAGFEITGVVNRKEFGLNWNGVTEAGGVVAGDKVKITANVQFIKQ